MIRKLFIWFFSKVIGWPKPRDSYFVAVREGREQSRVEELPCGKLVFYVDVTDVPTDRVEAYLKRAKRDLQRSDAGSVATPNTDDMT